MGERAQDRPAVFARISKLEGAFGCTIKKGESVVDQADKGQEFVSVSPERMQQLATGKIPYTVHDFLTPRGQAWELPAGAYKRCGGPT